MKRLKSYAVILSLLMLGVAGAKAQVSDCDPNGKDSLQTLRSYSLMHEDVKFKKFSDAKESFIYVLNNAPCFREQAYIDGVEIYSYLIENEKDSARKQQYLDTLDLIYLQRIKYYGREGYVKGKWGKDILSLDKKNYEKGMKLIEEAIDMEGNKLEDNVIVPYFNFLVALEKANRRTKDDVMKAYERLTEIIDYNIKNPGEEKRIGIYKSQLKIANLSENTFTTDKPELLEEGMVFTLKPSYSSPRYTITNIDSIDVTVDNVITEPDGSPIYLIKEAWSVAQENLNNIAAPYLDCETLANIYTPKFKADPTNVELMEKILLFLNNARCTKSELYFEVSEAYLKTNPNSLGYRNLAAAYKAKKNYAKAIEIYQKAADVETDDALKVADYINLAKLALAQGQASTAKSFAEKALAINPNKGEAYILIGDAYLHAAGGCTDFDKSAIYWVVVDQYQRAKSIDPGVAGAANRRIATYSKYFPKRKDGFFRSINEGDTYTLKCYPNLSTKARYLE